MYRSRWYAKSNFSNYVNDVFPQFGKRQPPNGKFVVIPKYPPLERWSFKVHLFRRSVYVTCETPFRSTKARRWKVSHLKWFIFKSNGSALANSLTWTESIFRFCGKLNPKHSLVVSIILCWKCFCNLNHFRHMRNHMNMYELSIICAPAGVHHKREFQRTNICSLNVSCAP